MYEFLKYVLTFLCMVCAFMCRYTVGKALSFCYKRVKKNKHKWHYAALIWTAVEHSLFNHTNKIFERIHYAILASFVL